MTSAVLANGTQIGFDAAADSPLVFDQIEEVISIGAIGFGNDVIDVTNLDSTSKENIAGLQDGVSFPIEMNWISSTAQDALQTAALNKTSLKFLVVFSDSPATKVEFTGTCESWEQGAESGSQLTATCTVKISGALDFTTTSVIT